MPSTLSTWPHGLMNTNALTIKKHCMHILLKFSMLMKTAPKHWKNKQNHVSKIVNGTQAGENFELNLAFLI